MEYPCSWETQGLIWQLLSSGLPHLEQTYALNQDRWGPIPASRARTAPLSPGNPQFCPQGQGSSADLVKHRRWMGSAHPSCCLHPPELLHQSMKTAEAGAPLQSVAALVQSTQKLLKIQLARERRWPTHQITAAQISNIIYLQPSTCLQIK